MSWTDAELAALKRAYASGTTRVSYEGKTVEYDDGDALLKRIQTIEADMNSRAGRRRPGVGFASFCRY